MPTRDIPKNDKLHDFLRKRLESRVKFSLRGRQDQEEKWNKAENAALAYLPEQEIDSIRRSDRELRGNPRYTTIQIPYSYALLMAAHTYMTSVFFARAPVHQFTGRHGEGEMQVQAVEALISYQVETGKALVPYYIWLYDNLKYGVGILGHYWSNEQIQYSEMLMGVDGATGKEVKLQQTLLIPGYKGNRVYNVSPFDFFHDTHFPIYRFQEGEYCGVKKQIGWSEIIRRRAQGFYMNVDELKTAVIPNAAGDSTSKLERPDKDRFEDEDATAGKKHPSMVEVIEVYVDLIQSEWRLGDSDFPEKWVFTITSDYATIIGAQPLGAATGQFPFDVMESEVEGYGLYSRGTPEVVQPLQNTMDWLINTHFYNVRASLNNQFLIDPSRVIVSDAEDGGPGFIYRLRPEAYGSDVRTFFYQVPVADVTQAHMRDLEAVQNLGEKITGVNDQMFGALSGGRKTATEVRTSTGFGVNRLKTVCEYASAMGMSPHAQKLLQMSQQFYDGDTKLKIVGDLASMAGPNFMSVTPDMIAGFYDLVPVDGTLPIDRMAMATLWQNIMAQMRAYPILQQQFDIAKIFTYVGQLAGVRNINQFKIQVSPLGALQRQAQEGNVIPLRPGPGPQPSNSSGVSSSGTSAGAALEGLPS